MNSASYVNSKVAEWKAEGRSKAEIVWMSAEACLGFPYVWGSYGQNCTVSNRKAYMNRSSIAEGDRELIRKRCQILNGSASTCKNCKYYPDDMVTWIFDCRGFTRKMIELAGGTLVGAGATSQWNNDNNWSEKGLIKDMPKDKLCCVFQDVRNVKEHTGLALGDQIIHCSVEVKTGHTYDKGWTHYAVPKSIDGSAPVPTPSQPTLRKGSSGQYVTLLQTKLIQRGYDLAPYGADGKFGNKTLEAVKAFQRNNDLVDDGVVGSKTWQAILDGTTPLYTVSISHVSKTVAEEIIRKYGGTMKAE